jgi:hypothetical protein
VRVFNLLALLGVSVLILMVGRINQEIAEMREKTAERISENTEYKPYDTEYWYPCPEARLAFYYPAGEDIILGVVFDYFGAQEFIAYEYFNSEDNTCYTGGLIVEFHGVITLVH